MTLFSLTGVRQVFEGRTVLDIEHLELSAASSYSLQGPNGSGKSTLLNILAFLEPPTAGEIRFQGRVVDWREKTLHLLRRKVVLVDQHPIMFSTTVIKNVEYGLRMRGIPSRKRRAAAEAALERVGLHAFADRQAHRLSGGETQRVAIARALACEPDVMLFDEPTASVDVENQALIEAVIQDIRRQQRVSVIFATHKRLEAARLAERRIFLFAGKVTGPGGENVLSGIIAHRPDRSVCTLGPTVELEVRQRLPSGPVRIAVKPEGIRVYSAAERQNVAFTSVLHSGRVLQMTLEGDAVKLHVDIGIPLKTVLSRDEAVDSGIMVGDTVRVAIDPDAIQAVQG
ncbi:ABC transporter ATP-binding protein [Desulfofustis glycolicus]|uniref:Tungstate transport system ATP-binding protein n=1 Tax=Desulfofustis glycolicus DSM 9705 TaxID=1121409 RepID=A0A1M5XUE0_9BACT|nr:ATP-binding cassette domain-containing protein [Desulfofustis glycolicus]MCB2217212.1 ATP-binding cassette domain-containing protein [Desulfobulbaceae bacterium]SHI03342.1 tungstate transport system ATP-binding protein [Desulfofustis glycolicus DSM 9705]